VGTAGCVVDVRSGGGVAVTPGWSALVDEFWPVVSADEAVVAVLNVCPVKTPESNTMIPSRAAMVLIHCSTCAGRRERARRAGAALGRWLAWRAVRPTWRGSSWIGAASSGKAKLRGRVGCGRARSSALARSRLASSARHSAQVARCAFSSARSSVPNSLSSSAESCSRCCSQWCSNCSPVWLSQRQRLVNRCLGPSLLLNGRCGVKVPRVVAGSRATARVPARCAISRSPGRRQWCWQSPHRPALECRSG